ncbi:hypothetical protein [Salinibacterium sp. PAMC 21357]|uniref:hypothetical protein n=1 Tax=Salinibacterium sp. PAMC 21357 TaxID=1112215 RepID=UPI001300C0CD|nr:hypothetical protein [Salinibacterium sp. PAMC 21357]
MIGNIVYVIGRSVVVRSRTGQGLAPLWVWIATQVLGIIVTIAFIVNIVSAMVNSF